MGERSLDGRRLGAVLLLCCAMSLPLAGQEGGFSLPEGEGAEKNPETLVVFSQHFFRDGANTFQIQGTAEYPDETSVCLQLFLRNRASTLRNVVSVRNGEFQGQLRTRLNIFPGYYEVRALFLPYMQIGGERGTLGGLPKASASYRLRIGEDAEIAETRRDLLDYYDREIRKIEGAWAQIRAIYVGLISGKAFKAEEAQAEWEKKCRPILGTVEKEYNAYLVEFRNSVMPLFPQLHENFDAGYRTLYSVYGELSLSLVTEFIQQAGISGKTVTREDILAKCDRVMKSFSEAVHVQIVLEREHDLRDLLLNQVSRVAFLLDLSTRVFRMASQSPDAAAREKWKQYRLDWEGQLQSLREAMLVHKDGPLAKENQGAIQQLLDMPDLLRDLWAHYDKVVVEGAPGMDEAVARVHLTCERALEGLMQTFEFLDEFKVSSTSIAFAAAVDPDVERRQVEQWMGKLEDEDPALRLKAIRLVGGYASAKEPLREGAKSGLGTYADSCALALALAGEKDMLDAALDLLRRYEEPEYREAVVEALGVLGFPEKSVPVLLPVLAGDRADAVRAAAAAGLGSLGDKAAVPTLVDALEDSSEVVRARAIEALRTLLPGAPMRFYPDASAEIRAHLVQQIRDWWRQNPSE